jgi:hypothetical protein
VEDDWFIRQIEMARWLVQLDCIDVTYRTETHWK